MCEIGKLKKKKENKLKKKKEGKDWDSPAKDDRTSFEFASIECLSEQKQKRQWYQVYMPGTTGAFASIGMRRCHGTNEVPLTPLVKTRYERRGYTRRKGKRERTYEEEMSVTLCNIYNFLVLK